MLQHHGLTNGMSDTDLDSLHDSQHVSEVAAHCTQHMMKTEKEFSVTSGIERED